MNTIVRKTRSSPRELPFTVEELRQLLSYDPETGVFVWLIAPTKRIKAGSIAGATYNTGYRFIGYRGRVFLAHRLAWLHSYGVHPEHHLDHINGVRDDNRLCNLREVTQQQNSWNIKNHSKNTSGYLGVSWHRIAKKWVAQATGKDGNRYLGLYKNPEDASNAYQQFIKAQRGEFVPDVVYMAGKK